MSRLGRRSSARPSPPPGARPASAPGGRERRRSGADPSPRPSPSPLPQRLGEVFLWLLLLLPPLLFWPESKDVFRLPKLLLSGWLALASLVGLAWRLRAVPRIGLRDVWAEPMVRALLPLLVVATATLATTRHPLHARDGLVDLWIGAACLAGWSLALPAARLRSFLDGLAIPALILAPVGILQAHDLWEFFRFADRDEAGRLGVTSLAGNPLDLGAFLVLPCLLAQAALAAGGRRRALWAAVLAVSLYALFATQSLTAIVAVVAASAVLWALALPRRRALLVLGGGAVLGALLLLAVAPMRERVADKVRDLRRGALNQILTGRLDGWRAASWMLADRPVAGVGHGAYRAAFGEARLALVDRGVEFYTSHQYPAFGNAHNEYLEAAAEWGLPGLAALAWAIWLALRQAGRVGGARSDTRGKARAEPASAGPPARDRALGWAAAVGFALLCLTLLPLPMALAAYPVLLVLTWVVRPGRFAEPAGDRPLAWAGLTALAVLSFTFFPFRSAMVAFPSLLFLAWLFRSGREEAGR
jgi:O-antigen ligase